MTRALLQPLDLPDGLVVQKLTGDRLNTFLGMARAGRPWEALKLRRIP